MNLKDYLQQNKIRITDFSRLSKISRPQLYRILKGRNPGLDTVAKIIAATNGQVTLEDLIAMLQK